MMALLEAVFRRPTQDRATLPFSVISKEAQVPIDEVEHVIMKALACVLLPFVPRVDRELRRADRGRQTNPGVHGDAG